jgi:hypothetical protein
MMINDGCPVFHAAFATSWLLQLGENRERRGKQPTYYWPEVRGRELTGQVVASTACFVSYGLFVDTIWLFYNEDTSQFGCIAAAAAAYG